MKTIRIKKNPLRRALGSLLCSLAVCAGSLMTAHAETVYDSGGFETFVPAQPLDGQDILNGPWTQDSGTSTGMVVAVNPIEGNQSVKITRAAGATGNTRWGVVKSVIPGVLNNVVDVYFDMYVVREPNDYGPLFGIEAYDGSTGAPKLIGSLLVDAGGGELLCYAAGSGALARTGYYPDLAVHHHYRMSINFTDKTYSLYAEGVLIHTEGFVDPTASQFTDAPLATLGLDVTNNNDGTAYYDNYRIEHTTSQLPYLLWQGDGVSNNWNVGGDLNWDNGLDSVAFTNGASVVFDGSSSNTTVSLQGSVQPATITVSSDQDYTFTGNGSIDGTASLQKNGNGMLTIANANGFSSGINVNKGGLRVANLGGEATGTGTVHVAAMSILSGNGSIGGSVEIAPGGVVEPGVAGPGTLSVSGGLVLNNAHLNYDIGGSSDQIAVNGNLTIGGVLSINETAGFGPGTYPIITYGGSLAAGSLFVSDAPDGYYYSIDTSVTGVVSLVVAPPPPVPATPSGLAGIAIDPTRNDLTWSDNGSYETGFLIERSTDNVNFDQIASVDADTTSYSDTSISEVATHYYRIRSINSTGKSDYSNIAAVEPPPVRDIVWSGDGTNNIWQLFGVKDWLDPSQNPTVFATGDNVLFDDSGSASPAIGIWGQLAPGSVVIDASQNYAMGGHGGIAGATSLTKNGSGTLTLANQNSYSGATTVNGGSLVLSGLADRWSFNNDLSDSVGGRTATIVDVGGNNAVLTPTAVVLQGGSQGSSDFISLGSDLMPNVDQPVTLEMWATQLNPQNWARIFDFGASSSENLFMSWTTGTDAQTDRVEWKDQKGKYTVDNSNQPYVPGVEFHIAMVIEPGAGVGGSTRVSWYSAPAANPTLGAAKGYFDVPMTPADLVDNHCWLGRSSYPDSTANASYDEFRVWRRALSADDLQTLHAAGADADLTSVGLSTGSLVDSQMPVLPAGTAVNLATNGAALDVRTGVNQTIGALSGVAGTHVRLTEGSLTAGGDNSSTVFAGNLGGPGQFTKTGSGTLVLSGTNTQNGATVVSAGTLFVTGDSSGVTGPTTIASGAILSGTGSLGGTITLESGSVVAPGTSVGTLHAGSVNLESGSIDAAEIDANANDVLAITGALTINATALSPATIHATSLDGSGQPGPIDGFNSTVAHSWKLISTTMGIVGYDPSKFVIDLADFQQAGTFSLSLGNGGLDLYLNYAPALAAVDITAQPGNAQASINWSSSATATNYVLQRSTTDGGPYATVYSGANTSYLDSGLVNETTYYYVVYAEGPGGSSPMSAQAVVTPSAYVTQPPATPAGLTASAGDGQVSLGWIAADGADTYTVYRSTTSGNGYTAIAAGLAATGYVDANVVNGTTYYYVVTASNGNGESATSNEASGTPQMPAPAAPGGLTATAGAYKVDLAWNASATASSYTVKRSTQSDGPYSVVASGLTATGYSDTGLDTIPYFYVVTAVNAGGESAASSEASATPFPDATYRGQAMAALITVMGGETPVSDTGALPPEGGTREASLLTLDEAGILSGDIGHAFTIGQADRTRSESSVANLVIDADGVLIEADFVMARAMAAYLTDGITGLTGESEIGILTVGGIPIAVTGEPNQVVDLPLVGQLVINEQIASDTGITVNAFRLTMLNGDEVVVASAYADYQSTTLPPAIGNDQISGGGWISDTNGVRIANFSISGGYQDDVLFGNLNYRDSDTGMKVKATSVTAYGYGPTSNSRQMEGTCAIDGTDGYTFVAIAEDNGNPGTNDTFSIDLSSGYHAEGNLGGGNIQLHVPGQ